MRTALVTGSSRGIGREIAIRLAKAGYNIVINYKENEAAAEETLRIAGEYSRAIKVKADIRIAGEVKELFAKAKQAFGFVDTVVNNAGVNQIALFIDQTEQECTRILDTNLKGAFLITKAFLPDMLGNRFGRIINISSMWGVSGSAMEAVYSASKAGLIGFTKALSKEVAPMGVTVNALTPGLIDTDMLKDLDPGVIERLMSNIMTGRLGQPGDVAAAAEFLASREAEYISGQVLGVNGEYVPAGL